MDDWLDPCLNADEMRATDAWVIEKQGVPSLDLMETAGVAVAQAAAEAARPGTAMVVCGKGNNGGDGLVAARHLSETGFEAEALLLGRPSDMSEDARDNLDRYRNARKVEPGELAEALDGAGVIVDAIFGTGFAGDPRDPAASAIDAVNAADAPVVATDIASGVNASTGEVEGKAVQADITVTFHAAKLGHWIYPGKGHTGELRVAPIGIPEGAPTEAQAGLIDPRVIELAPHREPGSTKFSSGQVLIVGASRGLTGSVCLSASAAVRTGAGYATVAVPSDLEAIFETKLTEVMSLGCASREGRLRPAASEQIIGAAERAACVVLGPGMGREQSTQRLAQELVERIEAPLVLDADGLNAHAGRIEKLSERDAPLVMTPHAGELARLLNTDSEAIESRRLESAREGAKRSGGIMLLKGDDTIVTDGERVAVNRISCPSLATAGTGDVLSGMIGAMIARGVEPFAAACAGVVAHSRAGRAAADLVGPDSVIATDVIDSIPAGLSL
jgi:ADP-dependent NAD(P)H-hydrate dehydratase / NAD(P)H-hydrate epimerase